jgi:hypothetical protein
MPRYRKWPKCFSFDETQRRNLTFAGVRLDPTRNRLELAPVASGLFPTELDLYAKTRVTTPGACRKWASFMVLSKTHRDFRGAQVTDVRFRLNDGTTERYWNQGAQAWIPASPNNWNTEQEVADNIASWPVQSLGVVVNLSTTNPKVTPYVTEIRLLFETDLVALEDYVIRSFVADLKEQLRPISILAIDSTGQTSIDLNKMLQAPYDVVGVDALYNNTSDPVHMAPVTGWTYDATTKLLLIPAQPTGHRLEVRFAWRPHVVLMQSQDYTEIAKIPVVIVDETEVMNTRQIRERPYVMNKATGDGFMFTDGLQGDIQVPLLLIAPSSRDLHVFGEELSRYFANTDLLRVRGQDEFYPIWPDSMFVDRSTPMQKETFSARVQARICNAVFYPEDARPITGVKRFKVTGTGGPTIEVP